MTTTEHTHANLPLTHVHSLDIVNGPALIESRGLYTDVLSEFSQVGYYVLQYPWDPNFVLT